MGERESEGASDEQYWNSALQLSLKDLLTWFQTNDDTLQRENILPREDSMVEELNDNIQVDHIPPKYIPCANRIYAEWIHLRNENPSRFIPLERRGASNSLSSSIVNATLPVVDEARNRATSLLSGSPGRGSVHSPPRSPSRTTSRTTSPSHGPQTPTETTSPMELSRPNVMIRSPHLENSGGLSSSSSSPSSSLSSSESRGRGVRSNITPDQEINKYVEKIGKLINNEQTALSKAEKTTVRKYQKVLKSIKRIFDQQTDDLKEATLKGITAQLGRKLKISDEPFGHAKKALIDLLSNFLEKGNDDVQNVALLIYFILMDYFLTKIETPIDNVNPYRIRPVGTTKKSGKLLSYRPFIAGAVTKDLEDYLHQKTGEIQNIIQSDRADQTDDAAEIRGILNDIVNRVADTTFVMTYVINQYIPYGSYMSQDDLLRVFRHYGVRILGQAEINQRLENERNARDTNNSGENLSDSE